MLELLRVATELEDLLDAGILERAILLGADELPGTDDVTEAALDETALPHKVPFTLGALAAPFA